MIRIVPSRAIEKETGIDFDTLNSVLTLILEKNFNQRLFYNIQIHKSRDKSQSSVVLDTDQHYQRNFKIYLAPYKRLNSNISTILHEIRHILQHTLFQYKVACNFTSYRAYRNSPEEVDARKFEKLSTAVTRAYISIAETSREIFEKNQLGTLV
tara:strand:- start:212 stop:673 length:462 start_codon:yes stop_codon:yes gene_type:complete